MNKQTIDSTVEKNKYLYWKGFVTASIIIFFLLVLFGVVHLH